MNLKYICLLFIPIFLFPSCSQRRMRAEERERKAYIRAGQNELLQTGQAEIIETIGTLDKQLLEIDKAIRGESGAVFDNMVHTNEKLIQFNGKLRELSRELYNQSEKIENIRVERIEPIIEEAENRTN